MSDAQTFKLTTRLELQWEFSTDEDAPYPAESLADARKQAQELFMEHLSDGIIKNAHEVFESIEVVSRSEDPVREAWDILGTAIVEKGDWRAAMQDAYQVLSDFLGIDVEAEGEEG